MVSMDDPATSQKLIPSLQAGSQFGKFVFSCDSRFLFCCCGSIIKVFNTTNGECLHDLIGHTSTVTGIAVNPNNALQLVSCGYEGFVIYWDYLDGVQLKQHDFHMRLFGIVSINGEKKSLLMICQTLEQTDASLLLWHKDKKDPNEFAKPKVLIKNCNRNPRLVSFGCNNSYAASAQNNKLTVYSMEKSSLNSFTDKDQYNRTKAITCVACHPSEYCIATGLENGRIILWYNFYKQGQQSLSTIHWHSLPVLCLNFSTDGSILLSGGHECVFVRWQMNNTNQRDFKPRMGAPVNQVLSSPDGNLYATGHSDNVIQLMDINLKILHVYRGLTRANLGVDSGCNPIPVGLLYDPRSRTIVTNGLPGHLQFFSLQLQRQLFNLDIVGQNYISPENLEQPLAVTEVTQAAVSLDGQWLATFEVWEDAYFSSELRLKFWQYSSEAQTYVLNTTVEKPHDKIINYMSFRPPMPSGRGTNVPTLATVGADQCFKLWTLVDDTDIYRENTRWDCDAVGFYRSLDAACCEFSCDGSSLAVSFEHLLTIWDPDNNIVRKTLSPHQSEKRESIRALKFGSGDCRYYLMTFTQNHLYSWNLLTLTVEWSVDIQPSILIKDPDSDLMAVVSYNTCFHVFKPNSSQLIYTHENVSRSPILSAVFIPRARPDHLVGRGWPSASQIYLYNMEDHVVTLESPLSYDTSPKVKIAQNLPEKGIASIMAEKVIKQDGDREKKDTQRKTKVSDDLFISTMLHSNEPISLYGQQYLSQLLVKKKKIQPFQSLPMADDKSDDDGEESHSSESEGDEEPSRSRISSFPEQDVSVCASARDEEVESILPLLTQKMQWCSTLSFD